MVSSSASNTSKGAASTWISRVASLVINPSRCATGRRLGPCTSVKTTTSTNTMFNKR
ncbi:Uncharacterised protein [Mycobacteroides abscessus subsp. abscessus]|nr:Uncharacterised protein [Mycobacteroides abscessus subsp. abscessus]